MADDGCAAETARQVSGPAEDLPPQSPSSRRRQLQRGAEDAPTRTRGGSLGTRVNAPPGLSTDDPGSPYARTSPRRRVWCNAGVSDNAAPGVANPATPESRGYTVSEATFVVTPLKDPSFNLSSPTSGPTGHSHSRRAMTDATVSSADDTVAADGGALGTYAQQAVAESLRSRSRAWSQKHKDAPRPLPGGGWSVNSAELQAASAHGLNESGPLLPASGTAGADVGGGMVRSGSGLMRPPHPPGGRLNEGPASPPPADDNGGDGGDGGGYPSKTLKPYAAADKGETETEKEEKAERPRGSLGGSGRSGAFIMRRPTQPIPEDLPARRVDTPSQIRAELRSWRDEGTGKGNERDKDGGALQDKEIERDKIKSPADTIFSNDESGFSVSEFNTSDGASTHQPHRLRLESDARCTPVFIAESPTSMNYSPVGDEPPAGSADVFNQDLIAHPVHARRAQAAKYTTSPPRGYRTAPHAAVPPAAQLRDTTAAPADGAMPLHEPAAAPAPLLQSHQLPDTTGARDDTAIVLQRTASRENPILKRARVSGVAVRRASSIGRESPSISSVAHSLEEVAGSNETFASSALDSLSTATTNMAVLRLVSPRSDDAVGKLTPVSARLGDVLTAHALPNWTPELNTNNTTPATAMSPMLGTPLTAQTPDLATPEAQTPLKRNGLPANTLFGTLGSSAVSMNSGLQHLEVQRQAEYMHAFQFGDGMSGATFSSAGSPYSRASPIDDFVSGEVHAEGTELSPPHVGNVRTQFQKQGEGGMSPLHAPAATPATARFSPILFGRPAVPATPATTVSAASATPQESPSGRGVRGSSPLTPMMRTPQTAMASPDSLKLRPPNPKKARPSGCDAGGDSKRRAGASSASLADSGASTPTTPSLSLFHRARGNGRAGRPLPSPTAVRDGGTPQGHQGLFCVDAAAQAQSPNPLKEPDADDVLLGTSGRRGFEHSGSSSAFSASLQQRTPRSWFDVRDPPPPQRGTPTVGSASPESAKLRSPTPKRVRLSGVDANSGDGSPLDRRPGDSPGNTSIEAASGSLFLRGARGSRTAANRPLPMSPTVQTHSDRGDDAAAERPVASTPQGRSLFCVEATPQAVGRVTSGDDLGGSGALGSSHSHSRSQSSSGMEWSVSQQQRARAQSHAGPHVSHSPNHGSVFELHDPRSSVIRISKKGRTPSRASHGTQGTVEEVASPRSPPAIEVPSNASSSTRSDASPNSAAVASSNRRASSAAGFTGGSVMGSPRIRPGKSPLTPTRAANTLRRFHDAALLVQVHIHWQYSAVRVWGILRVHRAARRIQSVWRGIRAREAAAPRRAALRRYLEQHVAGEANLGHRLVEGLFWDIDRRRQLATAVQAAARGFLARRAYRAALASIKLVQRRMRKNRACRRLRRVLGRSIAAKVIQRNVRRFLATRAVRQLMKVTRERVEQERRAKRASLIIQRLWRGTCGRRVVRATRQALRDHINRRVEGECQIFNVRRGAFDTITRTCAMFRARLDLLRRVRAVRQALDARTEQEARLDAAAIFIQRFARVRVSARALEMCQRCQENKASIVRLQTLMLGKLARRRFEALHAHVEVEKDVRVRYEHDVDLAHQREVEACTVMLQRIFRGNRGRLLAKPSLVRDWRRRRELHEQCTMHAHDRGGSIEAAMVLQRMWRVQLARKAFNEQREAVRMKLTMQIYRELSHAAICIQHRFRMWTAWRARHFIPVLQIQLWWSVQKRLRRRRHDRAARVVTRAVRRGTDLLRARRAGKRIVFLLRCYVRRKRKMREIRLWRMHIVLTEHMAAVRVQRKWRLQVYNGKENRSRTAIIVEWMQGFCAIRADEERERSNVPLSGTILHGNLPKVLLNRYLKGVAETWHEETAARGALYEKINRSLHAIAAKVRELRLQGSRKSHLLRLVETLRRNQCAPGFVAARDIGCSGRDLDALVWHRHRLPSTARHHGVGPPTPQRAPTPAVTSRSPTPSLACTPNPNAATPAPPGSPPPACTRGRASSAGPRKPSRSPSSRSVSPLSGSGVGMGRPGPRRTRGRTVVAPPPPVPMATLFVPQPPLKEAMSTPARGVPPEIYFQM